MPTDNANPTDPIAAKSAPASAPAPTTAMGVTIASCGIRSRADHPSRLKGPLDFLEHCRTLGAAGIQTTIGSWDDGLIRALRARLEETGMFLEGQIGLPRSDEEAERFARQLRAGKEAGAQVFRTVTLNGRRYETFRTAASFREFARQSWEALVRAEAAARAQGVRLALENHKDWRVEELLDLMERLDSEHVGICIDTGNSISLLEDPLRVVQAYAPFAFTSHFKDMAALRIPDGFLLSEVPLGAGVLDLPGIVAALRKHRPEVRLNLEMITRDPLVVPCLTDGYWATMTEAPAKPLADTLRWVRDRPPASDLPRVSGKSWDERVRAEEENNRASFAFARQRLGLG
jgi:sugar phosphate isomerase/epimerase